MSRQQQIALALADLVAELVDEVRIAEPYTRDPVGRWAGKTFDQRTTRHHTRGPGLLAQLDAASVPGGSRDEDDRRAQADSRPPVTAAFELLDAITTGAAQLRADLRAAAGRTRGVRQGDMDDLREIVALAAEVDLDTARAALRQVRQWVAAARVLLRYDAPVAELRDVECPYCGGALRVRSDASSPVWCTTPDCRDEEGNRRTWPRAAWLLLLNRMTDETAQEAS